MKKRTQIAVVAGFLAMFLLGYAWGYNRGGTDCAEAVMQILNDHKHKSKPVQELTGSICPYSKPDPLYTNADIQEKAL